MDEPVDVLDVSGEPVAELPAPALLESPRSTSAVFRLLAGGGGICLLLLGAVISFGGVLLAPLAMWIAATVLRRKGKKLEKWPAWFVACGVICVLTLSISAAAWQRTSGASIDQIHHNMDSLAAVRRTNPRPSWQDRLSPPGAQERADVMTRRMGQSRTAMTGMLLVGGILVAEFYAVFVGTLGWGGALLLHYSLKGRWLS
ncbi:MAG: hypothetical protein JWM95_2555 [Gemmatimonadetes bacterium]|nr:hypothetical protein [Gemmatimonadota bacterium]